MEESITAFVYGALMVGMETNEKNVAARCAKYKVTFRPIALGLLSYFEPAFAALEPAEPGTSLSFIIHFKWKNPGETLTEATCAHGVLCTMPLQTWKKITIHETSYEDHELQGTSKASSFV